MIRNNKIPYMGLIACFCYFITTFGLVMTRTTVFVILMELATVLSTPVILLIFMSVPSKNNDQSQIAKKLSVAFMTSCMILTCVAHFTNLVFIQPLMASGINIPTYFQIGQWPSALMTIDILDGDFLWAGPFYRHLVQ